MDTASAPTLHGLQEALQAQRAALVRADTEALLTACVQVQVALQTARAHLTVAPPGDPALAQALREQARSLAQLASDNFRLLQARQAQVGTALAALSPGGTLLGPNASPALYAPRGMAGAPGRRARSLGRA